MESLIDIRLDCGIRNVSIPDNGSPGMKIFLLSLATEVIRPITSYKII